MTCPPKRNAGVNDPDFVALNGVCSNPRFKSTITSTNSTGFINLFRVGNNKYQGVESLSWDYVIDNTKKVSYRYSISFTNFFGKLDNVNNERVNSLQEFANKDQITISRETISKIVNDIKFKLISVLNDNLEKSRNNPPRNPSQSSQTTARNTVQTQAQAPASGGTQATSPGVSTTQGQTAAVAPTSDKIDASLASLQDTGYLNTSKPKNFPLIDQPNGSYKPLSEVSRFVFDSANPSDTYAIAPEENVRTNSNNIKFSQSNRKYFGANLAVLNKLESVDFKSGFDKQDYIAYLIPYGTPGIASNPSQTVSTQIPGKDSASQGGKGNNLPKTKAEIIKSKYLPGYELFFGANFVIGWRQISPQQIDTPEKRKLKYEELKKQVELAWDNQINSLPSESELLNINLILENIRSVYLRPNYSLYEPLLKDLNLKITDKASFEIQKLKEHLESIKITRSIESLEVPPPSILKPEQTNISVTGKSADPTPVNSKDAGVTGVDPSLKIWQFLYNPQSITIDVKADYAESNTWGATDDGQSGQSVLWQRNKNPVMRLDEVVLNGFIHGKKVAQLEEGLFALLMSRDGPGQIEPTVWEFVWGRRRFGPCIINDIQVVEKQWEAGEVLTATVSFTLTQIPKWQIIDSTVKFYDPTAMGTFAAPPEQQTAPSSTSDTQPSGTTDAEQKANAPGGGGKNDPCKNEFNKTISSSSDNTIKNILLNECVKRANIDLYKEIKNIDSIEPTLNRLIQACSKKIGNKNPIILEKTQEDEYRAKGSATLKEAYRSKLNCVENSAIKNSKEAPTSNQLTTLIGKIRLRANDRVSQGSAGTFNNDYKIIFEEVARFTRNFSKLSSEIDKVGFSLKGEGIIKEWKNNKCLPNTIANATRGKSRNVLPGFSGPTDADIYASNSVKTCYQFLWLIVISTARIYKVALDPSKISFTYSGDLFIRITSRDPALKFPKELEIYAPGTSGNSKKLIINN